jgi:single-stranded DNA-binding protein
MIAALISGSLFRNPEERISKSGKQFVTGTIRVKDGDNSQFIRLTAFSDHTRDALSRLADGDALAVQGALKIEQYLSASGATKIGLSLVAEQILPLKQPPKKREPKTKPSPSAQEHDRAFDDAIPF